VGQEGETRIHALAALEPEAQQRGRYLAAFRIKSAKLANIGPARRVVLRSGALTRQLWSRGCPGRCMETSQHDQRKTGSSAVAGWIDAVQYDSNVWAPRMASSQRIAAKWFGNAT